MDLLNLVGLVTKRRSDYISQAKDLAKKYKNQATLEDQMVKQAKLLVAGFRDKLMRWEEYERTLIDKTLTSALAAVILGVGEDKTDKKIEKAWPIIVGDMLPPLTKFLAETKEYIDNGTLRLGDQTLDFRDYNLRGVVPGAIDLDADEIQGINPAEEGTLEAVQRKAQGRSWPSLLGRVIQYIANPTFSFFGLGEYMKMEDLGYKEMRRLAHRDKRVCIDCKKYGEMGWQPMGSLPMPGKGCRCYARCRCEIEYQ